MIELGLTLYKKYLSIVIAAVWPLRTPPEMNHSQIPRNALKWLLLGTT